MGNTINSEGSFFGGFGGRYVPEMLIPALDELDRFYSQIKTDPGFSEELTGLFKNYSGRPTPLYYAQNLSRRFSGCRIYLKLEGLNHTGAHKINNVLGQALLARKMGKKEIIAETGAGQHGLAVAAVAAKFGLKCRIFMGSKDIKRQYPNVFAMKLMGAEIVPVTFGRGTLKESVTAALQYWIENLKKSHYLIGSVLGPSPYPVIVRDFQSVIGHEVKEQLSIYGETNPSVMVAAVGGGSNAMGLFYPFLATSTLLVGVEAGGRSSNTGDHAVRIGSEQGKPGIAQGYKSIFLQDNWGQLLPTHSICAGLDYAGIGPEIAALSQEKRIKFFQVSDQEALQAYKVLAETEGIIPALESAHAVAQAAKIAQNFTPDQSMVINISGRGDKDLFITAPFFAPAEWSSFLDNEAKNGSIS